MFWPSYILLSTSPKVSFLWHFYILSDLRLCIIFGDLNDKVISDASEKCILPVSEKCTLTSWHYKVSLQSQIPDCGPGFSSQAGLFPLPALLNLEGKIRFQYITGMHCNVCSCHLFPCIPLGSSYCEWWFLRHSLKHFGFTERETVIDECIWIKPDFQLNLIKL